MLDEQTALVLALQLVALFSIAGALLLYLLCKIKTNPATEPDELNPGAGKPILVTSCDNTLGLQIALHLADRGFRVFAGLRDGIGTGAANDSGASRVIRSWQKGREAGVSTFLQGTLVGLPLDVTREDLTHEAVDIIRAHLPAGEDGIWAVINTSGLSLRGRLDQQDASHWEAVLKTGVIGVLRVSRTFQGLLKSTKGRIVTFGAAEGGEAGLVAYAAARYAVMGASNAMREEMEGMGVKVVTLNPRGLSTDCMFAAPKLKTNENQEVVVNISGVLEYTPLVLPPTALRTIDIAITTRKPKPCYNLIRNSYFEKSLNLLNFV